MLYSKVNLFPRVVFQNGADDVKKHRWFKTIDWDAVPLRKLKVRAALLTLVSVSLSGNHFNFEEILLCSVSFL